jgi:predicted Fe-Mo cluster-binding NifX family protein
MRGGDERGTKTAIASQGRSADGAVAHKAGRAPFYLFFGEDGHLLEVVQNPAKDAGRGAGSRAAEFLADAGVTLVVAGAFGPRMAQPLDRKHIDRFEVSGSVGDALEKARGHRTSTPR